ncbi:hypothetical protein GC163_23330 [bacterium]|nr:hypothetical protein [bacterium]
MRSSTQTSSQRLLITAAAAFCTYFCMYAFRKPFTAATFTDLELAGIGLKTWLVVAQLFGYMLSKFIGIKVIAEIDPRRRAITIVGLIIAAELALVGFAFAPLPVKPFMLFLNGLPLGMVFGLVLGYLEGRQQTEALSAALCGSFISASGVVKSVGQWLLQAQGISEYQMPMLVGLMFLPGLLLAVWVLHGTPPPNGKDVAARRERKPMSRAQRYDFMAAYWPGLSLLVLVYIALTVVRTVRDDFGTELWRDMGVSNTPSVFARSETLVAICVTGLMAFIIWIQDNRQALRVTIAMMMGAFSLTLVAAMTRSLGHLEPFAFMVMCGIGLYIPYVAFHTSLFERLIAASSRECNLGFLMYLADAMGYLGYAAVMIAATWIGHPQTLLPQFLTLLNFVGIGSLIALGLATWYFERRLFATATVPQSVNPPATLPSESVAG